jgi:hypothetical protein
VFVVLLPTLLLLSWARPCAATHAKRTVHLASAPPLHTAPLSSAFNPEPAALAARALWGDAAPLAWLVHLAQPFDAATARLGAEQKPNFSLHFFLFFCFFVFLTRLENNLFSL